MKRLRPTSDIDQSHVDKRRKTLPQGRKHHRLANVQPGADSVVQNPQDAVLIDYQLHKAICIALYRAGFATATRQGLSSFRDAVQEYMVHFSLRVRESMHACRRMKPIPQDFVHALVQFNLTPTSLKADLDLDTLGDLTQAPILPALPPETPSSSIFTLDRFISLDEKPILEKQPKPYIPKHFPGYPPTHAYYSTPVYSQRETDALKIRERATQEGMQAEHALRKLMAANKTAESRSRELQRLKRGASYVESEEVWKEALATVDKEDNSKNQDQGEIIMGFDGIADARSGDALEEANTGVGGIVNYDRMFWRRGLGRNRLRAA